MLTDHDYQIAADRLGCHVAAIKAFASVESAGGGYLSDGRPKVQYEPHVMYRQVRNKFGEEKAEEFADKYPDLVSRKAGGYHSLVKEHEDMGRAADLIDRDCALQSASWGAFQIMGYHWERLGYTRLQSFINAMYRSEVDQLDCFVRFIKADQRLHNAIQKLDWATAARIYNGPNYARFNYDKKMQEAFERFGGNE